MKVKYVVIKVCFQNKTFNQVVSMKLTATFQSMLTQIATLHDHLPVRG